MLKLLVMFFVILLFGSRPQSPMRFMSFMNRILPQFRSEFLKKWEDLIQKQPPEVLYKKVVSKTSHENTCVGVFFLIKL